MEITSELIQQNIGKAKVGNQVAFTFLLDFYWNEVYGFMLRRTENETDAEDITIETFAKAFDSINTYNSEYGFNTWLISIAKNVHIDMLRKKRSSIFVDMDTNQESNFAQNMPDTSPTIEDAIIKEQNLNELLIHVKKLKPHYQEVIQLRYFQELPYLKISEQIQEPLNNVKIKLLRAKKLLSESILKNKK